MTYSRPHSDTRQSLVTRTLWRIETELARSPSLQELAAAEGVSPFHLTRAFSLVTGHSVMAYVRARRLSEAARRLNSTHDSVLIVALDSGYDSHEGFARAFRGTFGCAPRDARETLPQPLQEPITMTQQSIPAPSPRIQDHQSLRLVGRARRYKMSERAKIPAQWDETVQELGEKMDGGETFGVAHDFDQGAFRYLVGFADDGSPETDELDHLTVPAGRYAVFEHAGHISSIPETWSAIFDEGMPSANLKAADGPEFERYAVDFDPSKPGGVSIWIPVSD